MADAPVGIFDSGFGGLTVARAVIDQLPHEPVLYLGDTARQPYGPKPIGEIREYALECLDHLVDQGVKLLVIACNSASAAVLRDARERYDVPVVEVIYPATRRAVAATKTGHIGVICTARQRSRWRTTTHSRPPPTSPCTPRPAPGSSSSSSKESRADPSCRPWRTSTSTPLTAQGIDTLILGCTHYPLLTGIISYVMGEQVTLVSSAEETAKDVYRTLVRLGLERPDHLGQPAHRFLTTGQPGEFERIGRRFLGPELSGVNQFAWVRA